ncbi:Zn-dependent exopeptidase, partial [Neoconidiobolus thromboides FSU 785]
LPQSFKYSDTIRPLNRYVNTTRMEAFLTQFSSFHTRFYKSKWGPEASDWLYVTLNSTIHKSNYKGKVRLIKYHHIFKQNSIIVKLYGSKPELKKQLVIVGAHMDSINNSDPLNGEAPGVDDDGTGTACLLESLFILLNNNVLPQRTIEFHFYAAEEAGLLGSFYIATDYASKKKQVVAMTQFDMTGYLSDKKQIGLITDYTDNDVTQLLANLIRNYTEYDYKLIKCGYPCSDHATWNYMGYRTGFPIEEDEFNPFYHTENDNLKGINLNHVKEYTKLAISFLIEVA